MRKGVKGILIIVISAAAFAVLDLPIRFSGFMVIPPYIGLKNAVAPTAGLLFGPWGVIGSLIGAVICGVLDDAAAWMQIVYEMITIVIEGMGMWLLWHAFTANHKVRFKQSIDLVRYLAICIGLSLASAALSFVFGESIHFLAVFMAYVMTAVLIGIPSIIIYGGIMCQFPIIPRWCVRVHDIECDVEATDESFIELNDKVEGLTTQLGLSKKRIFEILNTIEEVYLRIRNNEPEENVHITIDCEETLSIMFEYKGRKINPLQISADEDLVALIGLKLIEHRAIRTSYKYVTQTNRVIIVL
ncbi:MAG: hypothetical protein K6F93_03940 [Lachnospiraceae bacterium]|nr:hypothetical protein [Lachnospiraceae bacterium]